MGVSAYINSMFIMTEATPNPATVKFLPGQTVMEAGVAEFSTPQEGARSPLAERLFEIKAVKAVFFGRDFISVTKEQDGDWDAMKPRILAVIMEHFTTGAPLFAPGVAVEEIGSADLSDPIAQQIRELIETRVRPMVAMDGGDIIFDRFEDGIAFLHMRGACAGCPSSTATLKSGIENMLKHYVPEVREVRSSADY